VREICVWRPIASNPLLGDSVIIRGVAMSPLTLEKGVAKELQSSAGAARRN
jgi:hypothetical protein